MMIKFEDLMEEFGLPTLPSVNCSTAKKAQKAATEMGYPVVVKIWSDEISHKSDIDGVVVGIQDSLEVRKVVDEMTYNISLNYPKFNIKGVTIQKMTPSDGIEVIVGVNCDSQFGHTVMFGLGGIMVEVIKDVSFRVTPFKHSDALSMIKELKGFPVLDGARGKPKVSLHLIVDTIMRIQQLVEAYPDINELDINPLMVFENAVYVVDGRVF